MIHLVLYTRSKCHLCERMRADIQALAGDRVSVRAVDIDGDEQLRAAYWDRIPVLVHEDEVLCFGQLNRERLQALLDAEGSAG